MKFYDFDTEFTFGKYEGKTVREILEIQPTYLDWCAINLDHFYISGEVIEEIKATYSDFKISEEGMNKLTEKYEQWENEQEDFDDDYDNYYDDYDYSDDGCGEGFSCSECTNFGCNAHPCN